MGKFKAKTPNEKRSLVDVVDGDRTISDPWLITRLVSDHWSRVWKEEPIARGPLEILLEDAPRLPCELLFSEAIRDLDPDTLLEVLRGQKNTTAGPDGLCFQSYLPFGTEGVRILRDLLAEIAETGESTQALKEGTLFLIPKKGPPSIDNLRPITVANTSEFRQDGHPGSRRLPPLLTPEGLYEG